VRSGFRAGKARADNGHSAAIFAFGGSTFFVLLVVAAGVVLGPKPVSALPSFARQTGQPCSTCHSAFPQLTPFGRRFKLEGYTAGGTRCGPNAPGDAEFQIPIAAMTVPSFTHLKKGIDPADTPKGFNTNDNAFVQETRPLLRWSNLLQLRSLRARHLRAARQQLLSGQH